MALPHDAVGWSDLQCVIVVFPDNTHFFLVRTYPGNFDEVRYIPVDLFNLHDQIIS